MSKLRSIQEVDFTNWCITLFKLSGVIEADFRNWLIYFETQNILAIESKLLFYLQTLWGILEADFQCGCIVKWVKKEPLKTWGN